MPAFQVTRAHLKAACDERNWDLLDALLEIDPARVNDNALYGDGWGLWWGMLLEAVLKDCADGIAVLLKHGAQPGLASWGDGVTQTPLEAARDKPALLALLQAAEPPAYTRTTEPPLPQGDSRADQAVNRQGELRDQAGLVFPAAGLEPPEE